MSVSFPTNQLRSWIWTFGASALFMAGCGGKDHPTVYSASGIVTYKGDPLVGATVVFQSATDPDAKKATAITDSEGRFRLSTYGEHDGAIPGEHSVTVSKFESAGDGGGDSMEDAASKTGGEKAAKSEIPIKYSDPKTSDIQKTVKEDGDNEFKIVLKG